MSLGGTRARLERERIEEALAEHAGDLRAAAASLGISRDVLRRKLRTLGLLSPPMSVSPRPLAQPTRAPRFRRVGPRTWALST